MENIEEIGRKSQTAHIIEHNQLKASNSALYQSLVSNYLRVEITLPRFLVGTHVASSYPDQEEFAFCEPDNNPSADHPDVYIDDGGVDAECKRIRNGQVVPAKGRKLAESEIVGPQRKHIYKVAIKLPTINWEKIKTALKPREYTKCKIEEIHFYTAL